MVSAGGAALACGPLLVMAIFSKRLRGLLHRAHRSFGTDHACEFDAIALAPRVGLHKVLDLFQQRLRHVVDVLVCIIGLRR